MARVTGILCQVITGNVSGAGTDGRVFLGIGGREFCLDSSEDDYEQGSWREYILGRAPHEPNLPKPQIRVRNPERNDPRSGFVLDTAKLGRSPVYIRFEVEGSSPDWNLSSATVLVYTGQGQFAVAYFAAPGFDNLWLGHGYGKVLYLTEEWSQDERTIMQLARQRAGQDEGAARAESEQAAGAPTA